MHNSHYVGIKPCVLLLLPSILSLNKCLIICHSLLSLPSITQSTPVTNDICHKGLWYWITNFGNNTKYSWLMDPSKYCWRTVFNWCMNKYTVELKWYFCNQKESNSMIELKQYAIVSILYSIQHSHTWHILLYLHPTEVDWGYRSYF